MAQRDIAIIGFSETPIVLRSGRSQYDLAGEAMAGALKHAGIDKSEIDGMAVSSCFSDISTFLIFSKISSGLS